MNKAFVASLACATASAVKINATVQTPEWNIHELSFAFFCDYDYDDFQALWDALGGNDNSLSYEESEKFLDSGLVDHGAELFYEKHLDYIWDLFDSDHDGKVYYDFLDLFDCKDGEPAIYWASRWADWSQGSGLIPIKAVEKGVAAMFPKKGGMDFGWENAENPGSVNFH